MADFDSLVDDGQQPAASQAQSLPVTQQQSPIAGTQSNALPSFDALQDDSEKYGSGSQQAITGLEGAAKGLAGPLATYAETHLLGVKPEDIVGRAEANPWTHGLSEAAGLVLPAIATLGGSAEARTGIEAAGLGAANFTQAGIIGAPAQAAASMARSLGLSKVAQTGIKLAIEGGLFHASDNASKMILGQTDPEAPISSLLAGVPAASILGGGLGILGGKAANKLQEIANSKASSAVGDFLSNFGARYQVRSTAGDIGKAAAEEAQHVLDTTQAATADGFQLKRDAIDKLTANVTPENTAAYLNVIRQEIANQPEILANHPSFKGAVSAWENAVTPARDIIGAPISAPSAGDIFEATDNLKREVGKLAKFNSPQYGSVDQAMGKAAGGVGGSGGFYNTVRQSLENPGMWGEMGDFQKDLNAAYSNSRGPLQVFLSQATKKVVDDAGNVTREVDPDILNNLFKSRGRGKGALKSSTIGNALDSMRQMIDTVDNLHTSQGLESNLPKVPTPNLNEMLQKEVPPGAALADRIFDRGPGAVGWAGGHAIGTAIGSLTGHAYLGYRAGEHLAPLLKMIGEKPTNWAISTLLRTMSAGDPAGIADAMSYSRAMNKGASNISNGIENLFVVGGKKYMNSDFSDHDREKLKSAIENGTLNQQVQNQARPQPKPSVTPIQNFAHGGEVAPEIVIPKSKPIGNATNDMGKASGIFPEQAMQLGMAKGRINYYLNQIRPQAIKMKLPFDDAMTNPEHEKSYDHALDIANKPLSVLDHIKAGTIAPDHVQHLNAMYPELTNHLRGKISEKIVEAQQKNEKPPFHVRQGISLFMGAPVDSNFTPQNIQAAQATFAIQKAQNQAVAGQQRGIGKAKGDKLTGLANQYRTSEQAAIQRQDRSKV